MQIYYVLSQSRVKVFNILNYFVLTVFKSCLKRLKKIKHAPFYSFKVAIGYSVSLHVVEIAYCKHDQQFGTGLNRRSIVHIKLQKYIESCVQIHVGIWLWWTINKTIRFSHFGDQIRNFPVPALHYYASQIFGSPISRA